MEAFFLVGAKAPQESGNLPDFYSGVCGNLTQKSGKFPEMKDQMLCSNGLS